MLERFYTHSMLLKFRHLDIKTKWIIYTFIFIIFFSTILVSFFITTGKRDLERELKKWGISLTQSLADNARVTVKNKDYATLKYYLYGVMNHKEIIYSAIIDKSGSILAIEDPKSMISSKILDESFYHSTGTVEEIHNEDGTMYYHIIEPIIFEGKANLIQNKIHFDPMERVVSELNDSNINDTNYRIGTVILGISLKDMKIKLVKMRNKAIYIACVSTLFVFVFVFWGVNRLTKPIKDLDKAACKVAQGDLNQFVENNRVDEIGSLTNSFNEMIVKLKESQNEIENYTQTLERKVDERTSELQVSEQKYRTLFEHAGTAVALLNKHAKIMMVNKRFEDLTGYTKRNLERKKSFTDFLTNNDCKTIRGLYDRKTNLVSIPIPINHECVLIDYNQRLKKINLTISLIPGSDNLLVTIVDVTELRDLQKRLARSEQLATIGELSAAIAHEIRNPLVAINTSVGILKNALNLNGEDEELMNIIAEESMRLNKIVDDFLKFARPNEPQFADVDINGLIEETLAVLRSRFNNKITKKINFAKDLTAVLADPNQLKQVFMNIFINAIEAMPDGGLLTVSTKYVKHKNGHQNLEVIFKDTGRGIEAHELKKIFQPFYSNKVYGVGMGLAVCDRIIQNHGGEIKVESEYGNGAQFTIVLPA